jgi:hypothetical protein
LPSGQRRKLERVVSFTLGGAFSRLASWCDQLWREPLCRDRRAHPFAARRVAVQTAVFGCCESESIETPTRYSRQTGQVPTPSEPGLR